MCRQILMLNDAVCQKSENSESLIFKIMYDPSRTHQEVGSFPTDIIMLFATASFGFVSPLSQWNISCAICLQCQCGTSSHCSLFPHWLSDPRVALYRRTPYETWEIYIYDMMISANGLPPVAVVSKLVQK
jgi:hypothetical protein